MSFWGRGRPSPALLDAEQRCYNIQPSLGQRPPPNGNCPAQWDHQAPTRLISRETSAGAAWPGRTLRLRCWLRLVYSTNSRYSSSSRAKERFQCSLMRFLVCQYGGEGVVFSWVAIRNRPGRLHHNSAWKLNEVSLLTSITKTAIQLQNLPSWFMIILCLRWLVVEWGATEATAWTSAGRRQRAGFVVPTRALAPLVGTLSFPLGSDHEV